MPCAFTHSLKNVEMVDSVMGAVFFFRWASQHLLWRFYLNEIVQNYWLHLFCSHACEVDVYLTTLACSFVLC
jgi:hypothetical protein